MEPLVLAMTAAAVTTMGVVGSFRARRERKRLMDVFASYAMHPAAGRPTGEAFVGTYQGRHYRWSRRQRGNDATWHVIVSPVLAQDDLRLLVDHITVLKTVPHSEGLMPVKVLDKKWDTQFRIQANDAGRTRAIMDNAATQDALQAFFTEYQWHSNVRLDTSVLVVDAGVRKFGSYSVPRLVNSIHNVAQALEGTRNLEPLQLPEGHFPDDMARGAEGSATGSPVAVPMRRP